MPDQKSIDQHKRPEQALSDPSGSVSDLPNLPALSIRQPWAWSIVTVGKDIENRCWRTKYRGDFLIHAAKGCTRAEYFDAAEFMLDAVDEKYRGVGIVMPKWKEIDRGGVLMPGQWLYLANAKIEGRQPSSNE